SQASVLGLLSLIVWAMFWVVTMKYLIVMMRADNNGEGGILALLALALRPVHNEPRLKWTVISIGIFGAAMFYGDSMITPAISVLSAVEGVKVIEPGLEELIVPLTAVIIVVLFAVQRRGTAAVG